VITLRLIPGGKGDPKACAYCGGSAPCDGNGAPYNFIHRDGPRIGPEVPLCPRCAAADGPTCKEIWARIGKGGAS
jgi:hypothetical protein